MPQVLRGKYGAAPRTEEKGAHVTNNEFREQLWAVKRKHDLTAVEIAMACKASIPTVQRWLAAPHRVGRPSVFDALEVFVAGRGVA